MWWEGGKEERCWQTRRSCYSSSHYRVDALVAFLGSSYSHLADDPGTLAVQWSSADPTIFIRCLVKVLRSRAIRKGPSFRSKPRSDGPKRLGRTLAPTSTGYYWKPPYCPGSVPLRRTVAYPKKRWILYYFTTGRTRRLPMLVRQFATSCFGLTEPEMLHSPPRKPTPV